MTQYMLSVWGREGEAAYADDEAMQEAFAATDRFNAKLKASGSFVFAGGLHPIETSTVIDGRGEDVVTTDGPFTESKEFLGGFWIIEAADLDAATALAAEGSKACGNSVEVRPFQDV